MAAFNGYAYAALAAASNAINNMSGQANPPLALATGVNETEVSNCTTGFLPMSSGLTVSTLVLVEEIGSFPEAYIMRAYKTTPTVGYVYWVAYDEPDLTGNLSGYPPVDLADIVIVREPCLP